ncbi:MAG: hypothetical protein ACM3Q1_11990 [Bacteroidales bacterium]
MSKLSQLYRRWATRGRIWRAGAAGAQIGFYASTWMDEVWTRSTTFECKRRGLKVAVVVDGNPAEIDAEIVQSYRAAGIPVLAGEDAAAFGCPLVVSASTGSSVGRFAQARRVHMPHSLVSLHMIYGPDSFDSFDDILAAGPHHLAEFLALGRHRGLPDRRTHKVGYGKLDLLLAAHDDSVGAGDGSLLLAPSWGPNNLLAAMPMDWIGHLLEAGTRIVLRPHPLLLTVHADLMQSVRERFLGHPNFVLEDPAIAGRSIHTASALMTDYSGTALEFAALRRRPTVFVDVPPKVFNPDYPALGIEPMEIAIRSAIGLVAAPTAEAVIGCVRQALADGPSWPERIGAELPRFVFNPGRCAQTAADVLVEMVGSKI